jgi:hypothetical protein
MVEQNLTEQLVKFLQNKKADFIRVKELPTSLTKQLGLKANAEAAEIAKKLTPHLGESLMLKRGNPSTYLVFKQSDEDLLFHAVQRQTGTTPGAIAKKIPFRKNEFLTLLNRFIEQGTIRVEFSAEKYKPILYPGAPIPPEPKSDTEDKDRGVVISPEAFRKAFQKLERGKIFVYIYELRRHLKWPREEFDAMLQKLRDTGTIQLYTSDATTMTPDEIADGFVDKNGFRMGSITWNQ